MTRLLLWLVLVIAGIAVATLAFEHFTSVREVVQRAVIPGALSQGHAFLENNCTACHTGVAGVEAKNCIVCHADNIAVLQRQPTVFHSDIATCGGCHVEHQGRVARTAKMDHVALARIGLRQIQTASHS